MISLSENFQCILVVFCFVSEIGVLYIVLAILERGRERFVWPAVLEPRATAPSKGLPAFHHMEQKGRGERELSALFLNQINPERVGAWFRVELTLPGIPQ